jgi:hypothetical protein
MLLLPWFQSSPFLSNSPFTQTINEGNMQLGLRGFSSSEGVVVVASKAVDYGERKSHLFFPLLYLYSLK